MGREGRDDRQPGVVRQGLLKRRGWLTGSIPISGDIRDEHDWVTAWTSEQTFHVACGPGNLTEALSLFRIWASEDVAEQL
ncbi:Imm53 family immunity protein [Streptomyces sp. NPDC091376]|uniref:Imm53 family immunity protein n=1 Tax=Streptomyces sp. NPDC091376 TaxID=3365994 RepID=UPI003812224C